jgi:hypothetical protein
MIYWQVKGRVYTVHTIVSPFEGGSRTRTTYKSNQSTRVYGGIAGRFPLPRTHSPPISSLSHAKCWNGIDDLLNGTALLASSLATVDRERGRRVSTLFAISPFKPCRLKKDSANCYNREPVLFFGAYAAAVITSPPLLFVVVPYSVFARCC